jgi:hypothetical protein
MAFDLTVQHRNKKGAVTRETPYRLVIEGGVQRFEKPKGSGIWYDAGGNLISKEEKKADEPSKPVFSEADEEIKKLKMQLAEANARLESQAVEQASSQEAQEDQDGDETQA